MQLALSASVLVGAASFLSAPDGNILWVGYLPFALLVAAVAATTGYTTQWRAPGILVGALTTAIFVAVSPETGSAQKFYIPSDSATDGLPIGIASAYALLCLVPHTVARVKRV